MRAWIGVIAIAYVLILSPLGTEIASGGEPGSGCGSPSDLHDGWVLGAPEQQGFDAALLCAMGKGVIEGKLPQVDSIVVVRHGVLVYEHYEHPGFDASIKHAGYSMTKSIVSLLVGIAIDRGLIKDLDASVFSYFPEYADLRTPEKDRITLRRLLTMSDGLDSHDFFISMGLMPDPYRYILAKNLAREPGASFDYNNATTELIGAVLQKVSGNTIDVLATEDIFRPLGIDDVAWGSTDHLGNGNPTASTGLRLRPRDWAKIGQLVLNQGAWEGKQIIPASWITQSTTPYLKAWNQLSYSFQWWRGRSQSNDRTIEWTAALGFNAQKIIVIPELDLVVVFNASRGSLKMIAPEIELLDKHILPAISSH